MVGPSNRITLSKCGLSVQTLLKEHDELHCQIWRQHTRVISAPKAVPGLPVSACDADLGLDTCRKRPLKSTTQAVAIIQRILRLETPASWERKYVI